MIQRVRVYAKLVHHRRNQGFRKTLVSGYCASSVCKTVRIYSGCANLSLTNYEQSGKRRRLWYVPGRFANRDNGAMKTAQPRVVSLVLSLLPLFPWPSLCLLRRRYFLHQFEQVTN